MSKTVEVDSTELYELLVLVLQYPSDPDTRARAHQIFSKYLPPNYGIEYLRENGIVSIDISED